MSRGRNGSFDIRGCCKRSHPPQQHTSEQTRQRDPAEPVGDRLRLGCGRKTGHDLRGRDARQGAEAFRRLAV